MDNTDEVALSGRFVRLEPMSSNHVEGLTAAASAEPSLYHWSPVPQGAAEVARYVDTALAWKRNGTAVPYVIVRIYDDAVRRLDPVLEPGAMVMARRSHPPWSQHS